MTARVDRMTSSTRLSSIVIATDLSASSRHAADRAALLARSSGARLAFVHVVSGSAIDTLRRLVGGAASVERGVLDAARRALHDLAWPIAQGHGLEIAELLPSGGVVHEIVGAARHAAADLVVAGAHSADTVMERLLGSTTTRLLRTTHCPMLVVRAPARQPYRRVLLPLDFSPWTAATIQLARRVAPGAHLVLMHAWELPVEGPLHRAGIEPETIEQYSARTKWTSATGSSASPRTMAWPPAPGPPWRRKGMCVHASGKRSPRTTAQNP